MYLRECNTLFCLQHSSTAVRFQKRGTLAEVKHYVASKNNSFIRSTCRDYVFVCKFKTREAGLEWPEGREGAEPVVGKTKRLWIISSIFKFVFAPKMSSVVNIATELIKLEAAWSDNYIMRDRNVNTRSCIRNVLFSEKDWITQNVYLRHFDPYLPNNILCFVE